MPRSDCLTAAELNAFHLGDLPETDLEELAAHLEGCPRCEAADLRIVASHQLRDAGTRIGAVCGCTSCSRGLTSSKSIIPFQ